MGAGKTGTTSIASSFHTAYRSQHEPEAERTARLVIDYLEGSVSKEDLRAELVERDRRLFLEMESASPLGYVAGVLAEAFTEASFIVTIREPLSWLQSRLNYHHTTLPTSTHAPEWVEWRDYFWRQRHEGYEPEEAFLEEYGLYSLDTYLRFYADHYRRVLSEVPEERRLIIRTSDLKGSMGKIARFVGADSAKLHVAHEKRSKSVVRPLDEMDADFVRHRIMSNCGHIVSTFFPDRMNYYTIY